MTGRGIILVLAIGILFFGCFGQAGGGPAGETGEAGGTGATDVGGGTGGTEVGGGAAGGGAGGEAGGEAGGQEDGANDLLGKSYEELMGLGVPMQCDISMTNDEGKTTTVKVYVKNSGEIRQEVPTPEIEMCTKMVIVLKGDASYAGCEGAKYLGTSCDWLKIVSEETGAGDGTAEPPDYSDVPPTQINCVPWVPDDSKFATGGRVCTEDDFVNEMMQQYQQ